MATAVANGSNWVQLTTGSDEITLQPFGETEVFMGASAPASDAVGFKLENREIYRVVVTAYGGGVWMRWDALGGAVTYAAA
jgi:hypothetical protein